jgi:hypothetical protein
MSFEDDLKEAIEEAFSAHDLLVNTMEAQRHMMEPDQDDESDTTAEMRMQIEAMSARFRRAQDHLDTAMLWMQEIQREMGGRW